MGADFFARFQLAMKNHLLALLALVPEIVGHLLAAKQGTDFGTDKSGEPAHGFGPTPNGLVMSPQRLKGEFFSTDEFFSYQIFAQFCHRPGTGLSDHRVGIRR
jgi:hypothetical protein